MFNLEWPRKLSMFEAEITTVYNHFVEILISFYLLFIYAIVAEVFKAIFTQCWLALGFVSICLCKQLIIISCS